MTRIEDAYEVLRHNQAVTASDLVVSHALLGQALGLIVSVDPESQPDPPAWEAARDALLTMSPVEPEEL